MGDFDGAVALVTGGASGIGRGLARRLAAAGARVVVADVDEPGAVQVADEIGGSPLALDVADPVSWARAVDALEAGGRLDIAALNAGVATGESDLTAVTDAQYRRALGVNLDGVILGARAVLPLLRRRGRSWLLATASLAGLTPMPLDPIYAAAKHAVIGFVRSLAPQVAGDGITVQALCPGIADTAIVTHDERARLAAAGLPLLPVEQVVDAALAALASDGTGEAWIAQLGRKPLAYGFRGVPGARGPDGSPALPPPGWAPSAG